MVLVFLFFASLFATPQKGLALRDALVIPLVQKERPELKHFAILLRRTLDDRRDLLVVFASSRPVVGDPYHGDRWWGKDDWVGAFVQDRDRPATIHAIALIPAKSEEEGVIRIKRVTNGELLLARVPEKGWAADNVELLFDTLAGRLIREIRFAPFRVSRIVEHNGVPHFVATNRKDVVLIRAELSNAYFRIVKGTLPLADSEEFHSVRFGPNQRFALVQEPGGFFGRSLVILERPAAGKTIRLPLPQSAVEQYSRSRPAAIRNGWRPDAGSIQEEIGPFQLADGQLWFGKTFYDAEGTTGIGGFGYFDTAGRRYRLYSPPELRDWSVSALLVAPDAVWLSLFHRGEYGDSGGGVIRFDPSTQRVNRYELPSIAKAITRYQDRLYFATSDGVAFFDFDRIREFFIDYNASGEPRLVESVQ